MQGKGKKEVGVGEKLAYSIGMMGTNMSYGLTTGYLLLYFTDVFLIPAVAAGLLFLVARVWDAVNDPLMGIVADRTRTRWGKFRPYIFISGFMMAAFTVMLFFSPDLPPSAKIVYAYVAYIGWGMSYTMSDIPKWSMTSVMTRDDGTRVSLISWAKIFGMLGNIGMNIAVIPLVNLFGKTANGANQAIGYRYTGIVIAVATLIASLLMFFGTKERVPHSPEKPTLKESLGTIFKNKPLLLLALSLLVTNSIMGISSALQIYYVKYNLGNENLVPLIAAISIVPMLLGAGISGLLSKRFGKKRVYIFCLAMYVLRGVVQYFVGYGSVAAVIVLLCVAGLFMGINNVLVVAMLTDTIEVSARASGKRNEGIIFSAQTFVTKLAGAIGGSTAAVLLSALGYVENAVQTTPTLNGIHFSMTILPSLAALVGIVIIWFYRASENDAQTTAPAALPGTA